MQLRIELTEDETAKLHALGGGSWVRLQLAQAQLPATGLRGAYALTEIERQRLLADLPILGRSITAQKYRVKPSVVDALRVKAQRAKRVAPHGPSYYTGEAFFANRHSPVD